MWVDLFCFFVSFVVWDHGTVVQDDGLWTSFWWFSAARQQNGATTFSASLFQVAPWKKKKYLENPFWELLPKLHFSTGIAEFKKIRRKQKKMPTIFNSAEIWCSWAVHICNESWVQAIPPKLRAIPPKLRAIPPKSRPIPPTFFLTLLEQSFNYQFRRNWSPMMKFRRKPFFRAKSENSAEILNRQKLPYMWSSQVWVPTLFDRTIYIKMFKVGGLTKPAYQCMRKPVYCCWNCRESMSNLLTDWSLPGRSST